MSSTENVVTQILKEVRVMKAVVDAGVEVTDSVFKGIWQYFSDVELMVPLKVIELGKEEQLSLARDIIGEMEETFTKLENLCEGKTVEEQNEIAASPAGEAVNNLWKEFAGCYPELVNAEIPILPEDIKSVMEENMIAALSDRFQMDEDMIRYRLKNDSQLRMMIRMSGLDPDKLK